MGQNAKEEDQNQNFQAKLPPFSTMDRQSLMDVYRELYGHFGRSAWWPAESPFEVMVGAILTQQTVWKNVERAIHGLKREDLMDPGSLSDSPLARIEACIRPSGFYRQKAVRLRALARHLADNYGGSTESFFNRDTGTVRRELLSLPGVGPETADSMLLYAGDKPRFVVDAYTFRVFERLGFDIGNSYDSAQWFFEKRLPADVELYKNFHAVIVEFAKNICRPKPVCSECPLTSCCRYFDD